MKIVSLFVALDKQTNEGYGWCSLSLLLSVFTELLKLGENSFFILMSLVWTFDSVSLLTLKTLSV